MSIIVKRGNKILTEEQKLTTKQVIDGMTCSNVSSFLVVFISSEEEMSGIKKAIISNERKKSIKKFVIMGYSNQNRSFPIKASDPFGKIQGCFEINYSAIVNYKNKLEIEETELEAFLSDDVVIYTTESLKNILIEYAQTRKCIVISEYPSDNKPAILTSETTVLNPSDFARMLNGGAIVK